MQRHIHTCLALVQNTCGRAKPESFEVRSFIFDLLGLENLKQAPGPCQRHGFIVQNHCSSTTVMAIQSFEERRVLPAVPHFCFNLPLIVAETADPICLC
mmetsp:Transcript_68865/g.84412  ORF Transcript_68865/g.84412 Transcript_68865/m.84412 type:complete len:99 (+) Transcript_68865:289-585(+)